jgi:hypothetical protein
MGVATVLAIGTAAYSAYSAINEADKKQNAANELAKLSTPEVSNVADGLQVSTRGADLQREEQARLAATETDALQGAGTRGIISGMGRVDANNQLVNKTIGADLDSQQKEIDAKIANDNVRIQGINEQRHNQDVAALSSQYNSANQNQQMAIGNGIQALGSIGNNLSATSPTNGVASPYSSSKITTSGTMMNDANPNTQSLVGDRFNSNNTFDTNFGNGIGYATSPILTNPSYNPINFGAQNYNPYALGANGLFKPNRIPNANYGN